MDEESSMVAVRSLSESDVAAIREELSAGKQSTVWFTPMAVGVPAGGSAKVVSVGEVTEGEFMQVRPAGSRDMMFCSPGELTRTRPPRKRKPEPEVAEPLRPVPAPTPPPADPAPPLVKPKAGRAEIVHDGGSATGAQAPPVPAVRRSVERRPAASEVTVVLLASAEGEWTVEVTVGRKRVVRSLPVQPANVARAARSLPAPVTEAIEASLAAARERQTERVEQLRAELEAAQLALRELGGGDSS
jgi:hypothetical protein